VVSFLICNESIDAKEGRNRTNMGCRKGLHLLGEGC